MSIKVKQFTLGEVEKNVESQVNKFIRDEHICAQDYIFSPCNRVGKSKILITYTEEKGKTKELIKLCRFSQQKDSDVQKSIEDYIQNEIIDKEYSIKRIVKVDEEIICFEIDPYNKDSNTYTVKVCSLPLYNDECDKVLEEFFEKEKLPDTVSLTDALWCGRYLIFIYTE